MIDSEAVGKSFVLATETHGQWRKTFERQDDAEAVRKWVVNHLDMNLFAVVRDGFDVVSETRNVAPSWGPDPLDEDSGYGPDSYFGRATQRDD